MNNLLIVIHILTTNNILERTLKQVKIAFDNHANGVILTIGEGGLTVKTILECYAYIRKIYKTQFIGINFMCDSKIAAESIPSDATALWVDKGLGYTNYINDIINIKQILKDRKWKGLFFGGFCLKGNNQVLFDSTEYFKSLTWEPEKYFDVCVTSGISTGIPITYENFLIVKEKANKMPIAIASGINIQNIDLFVNHVDYFVVGTGVEEDSKDENIINFYKEANLPNPVIIGSLEPTKIFELSSKIKKINLSLQQ